MKIRTLPFLRLGTLALLLVSQAVLAGDGLLMATDTTWKRLRVYDPETRMVVYDLSVAGPWARDACDGHPGLCYPMGLNYVVHDSVDYVDLVIGWMDPWAGDPMESFPSSVMRFRLGYPPRAVWTLKYLDWRQIPDWTDQCDQAPDEPYGNLEKDDCGLQFVHSFRTVEDYPEDLEVGLIIADPSHSRILKVSLDYRGGNQIGTVEWVIDEKDPDWPETGFPNGIQYLEEPDGRYLLVTYYDVSDAYNDGGAAILFHQTLTGWDKAWQFPDPSLAERAYLNAPHMALVLEDPGTRDRYLFYAHGRGLTNGWDTSTVTDRGGTVGVAALGPSLSIPPVYLGEAAENLEDPGSVMLYPRDMELLPDGSLIVTDAACETLCPDPGMHHWLEPFYRGLQPSTKLGYFSGDHAEQELINVTGPQVRGDYDCGFGVMFEAQWVPLDQAGTFLRQAAASPKASCSGIGPRSKAPGRGIRATPVR